MNIQQTKVTSCKDDLLFAKLVQDADIIMYIMDSIFRSIDFHSNVLYTNIKDLQKSILKTQENAPSYSMRVLSADSQFAIRNEIRNKSVILDGKAIIEIHYNNIVQKLIVNMEMQRSSMGASPNRAAYNIASIITHELKPGEAYDDIPHTFCIFFVEHDIFSLNLPIYHIKEVIDGTRHVVKHNVHKIYVNLSYCANKDVDESVFSDAISLIKNLNAKSSCDITNKRLQELFHHYVETEEGVKSMSIQAQHIFDNGYNDGYNTGLHDSQINTAVQLLRMSIDEPQIKFVLKMTDEEEFDKILEIARNRLEKEQKSATDNNEFSEPK